MVRKLATVIVLLFVTVVAAITQDDESKKFAELRDAYSAAKTSIDKVEILKDFLSEFPTSRYSASVLSAAVRLYLDDLNDPDQALALVNSVLQKVEDPETYFQVQKVQLGVYGKLGKVAELRALVKEISKDRKFAYMDHRAVLEAAVAAGLWDMALEHSESALALATPEAVFAEMPEDRRDDKDQILSIAKSRRARALAEKGWALVNLDRVSEGMAAFKQAEPETDFFYLGFPETDLYLYWGSALLQQGKVGDAIVKLLPGAVMGGREADLEALKKAYAAKNGGSSGFEDFVWSSRMNLAKQVEGFTLKDYEGEEHSFDSLKGKVTILSFWFPT